jgi:hypothetical protein
MLIEFSVGNYRSFKNRVTLSMVVANITTKDKELDSNNLFSVDNNIKLLKSATIYGANASGKSNLIKAFGFMRKFVLNSSRESLSTDPIQVERFRLNTETENEPSFFEVIFYLNEKRYRYGFEVDEQKVHSEWLYHANIKETKLFTRNQDGFSISKVFKEGKGLVERTRDNALFLSVVDQWNGSISQSISEWFKKIILISGLEDVGYRVFTMEQISKGGKLGNGIITFIKEMDLAISDLRIEQVKMSEETLPPNIPQEFKNLFLNFDYSATVTTSHKKYDNDLKPVAVEEFDLDKNESEGTQKLFAFAGPLLHTLRNGLILIVDELDARFHPLITCSIIRLFNSNITNPHNAQLIFVTHDTNLLNNKLFRRDQIWFTEKSRFGTTDLYSLAEYKVRDDASYESDYISGRYGAIPYLGDIQTLVGDSDG